VYDAGNNADFIFGLRQEERDGAIVAPRIFASGANITVPGGYADNAFSLKVSELPRDRAALEAQFDRRPDVQKILYDSLGTFGTPMAPVFSDEVLKSIVDAAHARGVRTTVHAITELASRKVLDAGIDSFAHPVRAAATREFMQRLADGRVPVVTTLAVLFHIARVVDDPSFLDGPLFRATVDAAQREREKGPARLRYVENGMSPQFRLVTPHVAATVRRMHEAGVPLVLGTDRTWGASVHMELALLAGEARIPPAAVVRIATLNGAAFLGRERDLGSIEPGKLADLLLLREDPNRDVAAWQAIDAVYKGGRRIDLGTLDVAANDGKPKPGPRPRS
jgi:imidazolonepropionase-like amidohydrolase